MIRLTIPGVPISQPRQRHRIITSGVKSFVANYTPADHPVQTFKATIRLALGQVVPIDGPVSVYIVAVFPRPKNKIWKTRPMPREPHTSRPDCDNLEKSCCDSLTGLAYRDDAQIARLTIEKWIAAGDEQPHTDIVIDELQFGGAQVA